MPNLKKLLSKFDKTERKTIELLITAIVSLRWHTLDIKKLKGHEHIFRVRKGRIRIVFQKKEKNIFILTIERRREDTYRF